MLDRLFVPDLWSSETKTSVAQLSTGPTDADIGTGRLKIT